MLFCVRKVFLPTPFSSWRECQIPLNERDMMSAAAAAVECNYFSTHFPTPPLSFAPKECERWATDVIKALAFWPLPLENKGGCAIACFSLRRRGTQIKLIDFGCWWSQQVLVLRFIINARNVLCTGVHALGRARFREQKGFDSCESCGAWFKDG